MSPCSVCLEGEGLHEACCRRLYGTSEEPTLGTSLAEVESLALETVNRRLSVPGVQRKLSLSCLEEGRGRHRLTIVAALGGSHILKPPTSNYPGMPELEHWTMRLARRIGISVAECGLIPLASGEMAYVVRRFDREGMRRIAVEDFCQLSGQPTADKYRSSLERVGTLVRRWTSVPGREALRFFEVALFSFLTGNSDMHLKNWSLVRDHGRVELSPAYDLLPTRILLEDPEESALPIHGRKARIEGCDFLALAAHLRLPEKAARARMVEMPRHLAEALAVPSPWVMPAQATRLRELVEAMTGRLRL